MIVDCILSNYTHQVFRNLEPAILKNTLQPQPIYFESVDTKEDYAYTFDIPEDLYHAVTELTEKPWMENYNDVFNWALTMEPIFDYPPIKGPTHPISIRVSMPTSVDELVNKCVHLCMYNWIHIGQKGRHTYRVADDLLQEDQSRRYKWNNRCYQWNKIITYNIARQME